MRIGLLVTCLVDAMFPSVGRATVSVLEALGHEVVFPQTQTCCGQMHLNTGYPHLALPLIRRTVDAFEGLDLVVAPSGSCVGSVRHQAVGLAERAGDQRLADQSRSLAARTYELSELLVDVLGVVDVGARYPHSVTYHPTCHSLRMLGVSEKPLQLLREVRELELVALPDADQCCGFGGTFALKNSAVSGAMLADKVAAVLATDVHSCAAGDSSCLMHIGGGLSRAGSGVRPIHLAEILASR